MVNANAIRGKMAEKRLTQEDVCKFLKMTPKTFRRKLSNGIFDSNEIVILTRLLGITEDEFMPIFFTDDVTW